MIKLLTFNYVDMSSGNMKFTFTFCVIILLSAWRCHCSERILFPLGKEVVYEWNTHMNSGTILPSEVISHWNMTLQVTVQQPDQNITFIKLKNVGEGGIVPELELPFQASFCNGELVQISTHLDDQPWSRNIKRALVSLLQLKLDFINVIASQSFITQEIGLQGNCKAEYAVLNYSPNILQVKKMIDVDSCAQKPVERITSSPLFECTDQHYNFESLDSERLYTVTSLEGNEVLIQNITAVGVILEQPYQAQAEAHYSKLTQSLSFISINSIETPIAFAQEPEIIEALYESVNLDPTFGKEPSSKAALENKIFELMSEISDSLSTWEVGVKGLDNQTCFQLVDLMWWLDMDGWEELHRNVTLGTSYRQETIQHLFWELVPQVGSEQSTLFIKSLITTGRLQYNLAIKILGIFPFYIRDISEQLLTQFEDFLKLENAEEDLKQAAILSFASLLRRTCAENCKAETIDRYAKLYLDKFTESKDYSTQMIYLQGLANMELSQVLEFLSPVITGHDTINRHLRFLASWATLHAANTDSTKIFEVFWPIFINREQSLEMRVCALTLLIMSKPTTSRFLSIYWYMSSEPSQQLYNFYYTTIHSLATSNYPCYSVLASGAKKLARYIPPKSRHWSTGNYILDFEDSERGFGGLLQTILIASQSTGLPNVFMFTSEQHALAYSRKYYLYLKIAGLDSALYDMFYQASEKKDSLSEVFKLLDKLKVEVQSPEEIHLELIFKVNSRTVYAKYLNRTNFYEWSKEIYRVSRLYLEFSVNHQSVSIGNPGLTWYRPSDMGTPIAFLVRSSSLFSARGSISQDLQGRARNAQLDVRYSWNGVTSLRIYDPIKNQWHGADRTRNLHVRLPFATRLNLHFENSFFNVTAVRHKDFVAGSRLGLVWHSSTRPVSTTPVHKNYPNISDDWSMDSEDLGARLGASVFDCVDRDTLPNALNLLKNAFMINHKNHHMVPGGVIILALMSLKDQLHFQPTGKSCGVILYFSPLISKVEPVLEVGEKGFKVSMFREDSIVWEIIAGSRRLLSGNQEFTIKLNRAPRVSSEGHWRVLQLEGAFEAPSRDALPQALALSGYAFLSWGDGPRGNSESQAVIDVKVTPARPNPPCTDLVPSCLQAASDLAAIQTASLRYSNLPGWLKMAAHALFPEHIQTESTETKLTFAYPVALLPWNTKGLCAINGGSVLTLDNATVSSVIDECYTLAVADCSQKSLFAILVNRVQGILGAKVYCNSDIIRLEPSEDGISSVYINETKIANLTENYQNLDFKETGLSVSKTPEGVIEVELRSGVVLRHYNTTVVALIPARFRGSTCGVCGDFNGDTSNEPSLSYQDCLSTQENLQHNMGTA